MNNDTPDMPWNADYSVEHVLDLPGTDGGEETEGERIARYTSVGLPVPAIPFRMSWVEV